MDCFWLTAWVHRELKMAALLFATSVRNRTLMGEFLYSTSHIVSIIVFLIISN